MEIGQLRHRVTIENYTEIKDDATGQVKKEWQPFAKRWASIEPLRGRQFWAAAQTQSEVTHVLRMWHVPGLTAAMRIRYGERIFAIEVPLNIRELNQMHEIMATERAGS